MSAGSTFDYTELLNEELERALKEHKEPWARAQEAGPEISYGFAWLVKQGLHLDHDIKPEAVSYGGSQTRHITNLRELLMTEMARVRNKTGKLKHLFLNRAQQEYASKCTKKNIVLKARQLGITTYVAARFFVHTITHPGTLSVQVAHDQQSAEEIFRIVHRFVENLPAPLRKGVLKTSKANVREIFFPYLDSGYVVASAGAPNAGRGLTIQNLHCSEVARWPRDGAATLASLRAAVPPDGEIVLESTPNGACGCFYDEWLRAHETGFTKHFLPWWWEPTYRRDDVKIVKFTDSEIALMCKYGLDAGQIAFRREVRANFGQRMAEEYAEDAASCFLASGECVFDVAAIDCRLGEPRTVVSQNNNGRLQVYFPPVSGAAGAKPREYIIGADPSGGHTDGDYACVQVIERATGLQCAELQGHFSPQELASQIAKLAREYNQALIAVERNNHGHAVLAHLDRIEGGQHVYYQGNQPGWLTNAASRPRMLENFAATLSDAPFLFSSTRLLQECRTFVRHPDGSASAASGTHDDLVMAMAVALAVRAETATNGSKRPTKVAMASVG